MTIKLTKRVVDNLQPRDKEYDTSDSQIKGFLVRVHPTGRKCFYYTYRNSAKKRKRIMLGVFGSFTVEQARDKAKDYATKSSKGVDVQAEKQREQERAIVQLSQTLTAFLDDRYESWILESQKSGQITIDAIRSGFKSIMSLPLQDITHRVVDDWRVKEKKRGIKATTINRKVNALRGVLSRAVEWGVIDEHPFKKLKDLKTDKNPKVRYLSEQESNALFATLEQRDNDLKQARESGNRHRKARGYELLPSLIEHSYADRMTPLIILSLKTGLRRGEAFDLEWSNINFEQQQITLTGDTTKSSSTRHIPLSKMALDCLKAWKRQAPLSE